MKFRMNSPQGKEILALVRGGDYAHPGEEAAIAQVAQTLPRRDINRLLDVGCGRGGTADWLVRHGWGTVVGVDIDGESIEYARHRYGGVDFARLDVVDLHQLQQEPADLAYLFNAFYAYPDQPAALKSLRKVCRCVAYLLIFDYTQSPHGGVTRRSRHGDWPTHRPRVHRSMADGRELAIDLGGGLDGELSEVLFGLAGSRSREPIGHRCAGRG